MKAFKPIGITHITIRVNNMARSEAFYSDVLGFEVERKMGKTMTVYRIGTDSLVLVEAETGYDTVSRDYRVDHFGFNVESAAIVDQMAAWCKEHDVSIVSGPGNRKNGRYLFITDPDGNMIELFHEDLKA
ncbi:VOC family protein [bacterium]|nr:MAG: VOC family protein [bacterium]